MLSEIPYSSDIVLHTSDQPAVIGTFLNDTVILDSHEETIRASTILQIHLDHLQVWMKK